MKADRIALTHVRIPLVEPFKISNGVVSEKDGIMVSVFSDGLVGIGEASPMSGSFYSDDTPDSTWSYLTGTLIPRITGKNLDSIDDVNAILDLAGGNSFARAGIETAFWDLQSKRQGIPLFKALGGTRNSVESGLAVGIYPGIQELIAAIGRYLAEGYVRVKIKIQPGWDIAPLAGVRKSFGDVKLMVDANGAYTRADIPHLRALDDFDLMMVEQPLAQDDLEGHAELQSVLRTPVCLDESAKDCATVKRAIALNSCRIVNIKIQRVGGLKHAVEMHDVCAGAGIPVWGGTMPELGIGGGQTLHLSTLGNFTFPTDVESSLRWFVDDIVDPLIQVRDGKIGIPEGSGNCFTLNYDNMKKYTVREGIF
jgi:O-succinylbenzoate synthase